MALDLSDDPTTLAEWLYRLRVYEDTFYVRALRDGKWTNAKLSELPPEQWAEHVAKWLEDGFVPVRLRGEE